MLNPLSKVSYQHIIWDWNGTLLNDINLCLELTNRELALHKIAPVSLEHYRLNIGHPVQKFYTELGIDIDDLEFHNLAERFLEWYTAGVTECSLQAEAKHMISSLSQKGVSQSILSAHHHPSLLQTLNFFGLDHYFSFIRGLELKTASSKLELGRQLLSELPHQKQDILLIGDTDHDAQVAKELGLECILVSHGYQTRTRLEGLGFMVVDNLGILEL